MKNARRCRAFDTTELLAWVDDVVAAIMCARCIVGTGRFFFTVTDGFQLAFFHALYFQGGDQGLSTFLTQGQIVFCAAAVIGIAFDFDRDVWIGRQELGVISNQCIELWLDGVFVEVEVDATIFVDRAVWVQVSWQWCSNWCWHWCGNWRWCWRSNWRWRRCWCRGRSWGRASAQQGDGAGCQQDIGFSFHRNTPELILLEGHGVHARCEAVPQPATGII